MVRTPKQAACRRSGFTLMELLVVVAIISILVSLAAVSVFRLIGTQQSSNTKSELTKLESTLQQQYRAAADKFSKEPLPPGNALLASAYNNTVLPMAGGDVRLARVIWVKLRLKQMFPNSFNEALNPQPLPPLPTFVNALTTQCGYTPANTTVTQPWESSVCVLLALERAEEGGGVTPEVLGVSSFITDFPPPTAAPNTTPNGQHVKGLVDGWHNPIVFSRWPVGSTVLNPNGAMNGDNNDAGDPSGLLVSTTWQSSPGYVQFTTLYGHAVPVHTPGKEATTFRIFPLVASAGPDGFLGLNPITFAVTTPAQAADNLYPTLAPAQQ